MSTLVDQARMRAEDFRYGAVEFSASQATGIFHLLRQLADRVQELEGRSPPSSVQPEKEERRPLTDKQIDAVWRDWLSAKGSDTGLREFARAIEAAHGISPSPSMVGR